MKYNCGLVAYDAVQETVLNQKDPDWKIRNPNCPAIVSLIATPATTAICAGSTFDVTIRADKIDTQPVDGIEMSLKFDPSQLQVNSVTNSGVLDFELDSNVDPTTGKIAFSAIALDNAAQTESFDVFTINFTAIGNAKTTVLDLLDNSKLTNSGETVLASIVDNTLTFSQCLDYQVNLQRTKPKGSWANTDLAISLGTETVAKPYPSTANAFGEGTLTLADVPTNSDYFCVKNSHTLANKIVQTYPKVGNRIDFGTLWEGDAKEDNKLDTNDASFIASKAKCYTACLPTLPASCSAKDFQQADLNVDGCVNVNDVNLFKSNFQTPNLKTSQCSLKATGMYRKGQRGTRDGDRQGVSLGTTIPSGLTAGTSFDYTVRVNANETQSTNAAAIYLNFDPAQLRVNRITAGETFDFTLDNAVDNTKGEINFAALVLENPMPTQSVELATINLTLLQSGGEQTLAFSTTEDRQTMIANGGEEVTALSEDGKVVVEPVTITPPPVTTGDRTAHGTLLDDQGNPIAGVTIDIDGKTTTTDALGNWEINSLVDETTYLVTARKDGYTFAPTTVDIGNETVMTEVTLAPLTTLKLTAKPSTWKAIGQGEELTYTFTITNGGQQTATGLTLTEQLPEGATLVSLTTPDGTCDPATTSCTLSDLTPGATATVTLTLKAIEGGTLKNVASLTSTEYPVDVQTSWKVVKPYLAVTVTDTPDPVVMLGTLHYTAQVELSANAPQPTATGVTLTMQLPQGVKLDAVTTAQGTCDSTQLPLITCQLADLSIAPLPLLDKEGLGVVSLDKEGLGVVSVATVNLDVTLADAGLLVLTQDAKVTAKEYPAHTVKTRTNIFVPKDLKVDAVLVLDTTHSMQGELNGVVAGLKKFIDENIDSSLSPTIALIGFKDDVKVLAFTKDLPLLQKVIAGLKAEGGGLCPEASVEALNVALDHVKDNGVVFFSTDASPYDDADMDALAARLKTQQVTFNAVVSGDCGEKESWNEVK